VKSLQATEKLPHREVKFSSYMWFLKLKLFGSLNDGSVLEPLA
jgi:hypothetical protein